MVVGKATPIGSGMAHPNSPQAKAMADESMIRTLAAQAEAIWPQEEPIFVRHSPATGGSVLDVGCGTGEIVERLAAKWPEASFVGVDVEEPHLERARARCARFGGRTRFEMGDAMALAHPDGRFDLVISRHVVQALPDAPRAVAEMARVAKPGGRLHVLAEDYGMLWCHPTPSGSDGFWQRLPPLYGASLGCDLHVGRKMFTILADLGLTDVSVDHIAVDTIRVPRETFARIWEAWRDGYAESIAEHTGVSLDEISRRWKEMIACVRDPRGFALWQVPVWTARKETTG
jgi:SAM-dependent methyltransferase